MELYAEKVNNRGLCAVAQAESLRYKLLGGLAVRRCVFTTKIFSSSHLSPATLHAHCHLYSELVYLSTSLVSEDD